MAEEESGCYREREADVLLVMQVVLMFGPEYARSCGTAALEPLGVYLPGTQNYPGTPVPPKLMHLGI